MATWCEELTQQKRPWGLKRLQKEKGEDDDEMVRHHQPLNGHEFEQTSGDSGGQKSLGYTVQGVTESLTQLSNWTIVSRYIEEVLVIGVNENIPFELELSQVETKFSICK